MNYLTKSKEELIKLLEEQRQENDSLRALLNEATNQQKNKTIREAGQNEERLRVITESSLDAIILMGPDGNISFWNPAAERLLGYSKAEATGRNLHKLIALQKYHEAHNEAFPLFKHSGEGPVINKTLELEALHKNGHKIDIELSISKIKIDGGWHALGFMRDITQKKQAENLLRESEWKYRNLVESINDVIYEIRLDGTIVYISPAITKITGHTSQELIGTNFFKFTHPNDIQDLVVKLNRKSIDEISFSDFRVVAQNGEIRWLRTLPSLVVENGVITGRKGILTDITKIKLAEIELKESEQLYRSIINTSPDSICITSLEGTILFASPQTLIMFGMKNQGDYLNRNLLDFIATEDQRKATENIRLMFSDFLGKVEYKAQRADGRTFDIEVAGNVIRDSEDNPARLLFISRDITKRKAIEEELRQSEESFRNMVENINDVVYEITNQGIVNYVSPSIERFLGYKPEELIGQNFFRYMHKDDRDMIGERLANLNQRNYSFLEYRYYAKDGNIRWVRSSTNPTFKNGKMTGGRGVLIDITERKKAEQEVRLSEQKYKTLFFNSPEAYLLIHNGKYIDCNTASEKLIGGNRAAIIGKTPEDLSPEYQPNGKKSSQLALEVINEALTNGSYSFKWVHKKVDGTEFLARIHLSVIDYEDKKVLFVSWVDITAQHDAEEKLRQSETRYKTFFEGNNSVMLLIDPADGSIRDANPSACRYYGWSREQLCSMNISDINTLAKDRTIEEMTLAKELRRQHFIFKHRLKSGEIRDVEVYSGPMEYGKSKMLYSIIHDITDRIKAETQLLKLSQAIEQSPVSIVITNLDGNIEYANPKACETTGYTLEELNEQNPRILKSGEMPLSEYRILWDSISGGKIWRGIFHNKRKNGELYWESSQISPIIDEHGTITSYLAIKEDITEQKRVQEELVKSENRFAQMAEQTLTVIWEIDENGLYTYVSPVSKLIWGYDPEELVHQKYFYELHPLQGRKEFKQATFNIFKNYETFKDFVNPIVTKDKSIIWVATFGEPILDKQNRPVGYRGACNDITARKLAEDALKQNEIELNYAQEIANMGSWILDLKSNTLNWSKNYYRLLGLEPFDKSISDDHFTKMIHPDDAHLLDETLQKIHATRKEASVDLRIIMPDQTIKWVQNNIVPVFEGGQLIKLQGVNIDISEKKATEEKMRHQNERLNAVLKAIPDLIFINDKEGNYLEFFVSNPEKLLVRPDQIIGRNVRDTFDSKQANYFISKINEAIDQNETITFDYSIQLPHSQIENFEARVVSLSNDKVLILIRDITEKTRKEAEIKRLSLAVEQSPVSIIITSLEANIEYVNPAFEQTTGYLSAEVIGKNTDLLRSGKTPPSVYKNMWETIEKGEKWEGEWINKKKNGALFWEYVSITPIHNAEGNIINYLAIKQDITERKRTEEALKKNEEKYRYMFVNNPQPMWIYDLESLEFLEVNAAAIEHYGYSREEFLAMTLKNIRPGEDVELLLADVAKDDNSYNSGSEWHHLKKNGELIDVEIVSHPIIFNGRKARHVLVNDITRRKKTEIEIRKLNSNLEIIIDERTKALANSEKSYRLVVENVAEVIFQTDADGLWVFLNKSWEEITGFSVKESIGQLFLNYVYPDDRTQNRELFEPLIKREKDHCRHEIRYLTKDGGVKWVEVYARLGLNEKDEITGTYGTLQDITERKEAEEALKQASARLELALRVGGIGVWDYDVDRDHLVWDEQMIEIYNLKKEDFQNTQASWLERIHPDDRERTDAEMQMAIRGEKELDLEFRISWTDSSVHHIKALAALHYDLSSNSRHIIGINWDISLQKRLAEFENELLQLSPKLTGIRVSEINAALNLALSRIGKVLNADRSYIFEYDADKTFMINTFEWCNDGIDPQIQDLQQLPCKILPNWMRELDQLHNIIIESVKDLPESWLPERKILEPQGIQSLIVIPMLVENNVIGFVGLDSVKTKKNYTSTEINILKVWSSMLSSLINNQRNEKLLEQTRQNYETFFNTIDDFLWVLDRQGNVIHTNDTVKNRLKYPDEQLLGQSVIMVHPATRREEAVHCLAEMLAGTSEMCPIPIVTKSGTLIPVETKVKPGFWDGKQVVFGVSKDISKIKLSEEKFSAAFQSNSAMMVISNFENGKLIDVNQAFIDATGYQKEELLGKTIAEFGILSDQDLRANFIRKIRNGEAVREIEAVYVTKNNEQKTGLHSSNSIFIGDQQCLLTVTVDISERKKAEEELEKARKESEQANLAKSEFLSRMSHELRTPMNSILGFAQLLEMGELSAGQRKGVNHIMKSGRHLLDLINEVLDISRIESGHLSLSLEPVQVGSLISEMTDAIKLQAINRNISIHLTNSHNNSLFVWSDRQRLKQVLLNLLNNAVKYNRDGGSVSIKVELYPNEMVRVSVVDTGNGIANEFIPKLFTPFERIGADKTATEGTGLGLSVVKKLMEAMGGAYGVESTPGEGSTFWVALPRSESQLENASKSGNLEPGLNPLKSKTGTILYIEDNRSNIELVEQILSNQRSDIELITDIHGKRAVPLALQHKPDLILLDLNLPDIHGSVVLQQLQAVADTRDIPVVVISADAMPQQLKKLLSSGAKNYLTKPLDIPEFLKMITDFLPG